MSDLWSNNLSFPDHSYAAAGEGVWGQTRDLVTRLMRDHYQGVSTTITLQRSNQPGSQPTHSLAEVTL